MECTYEYFFSSASGNQKWKETSVIWSGSFYIWKFLFLCHSQAFNPRFLDFNFVFWHHLYNLIVRYRIALGYHVGNASDLNAKNLSFLASNLSHSFSIIHKSCIYLDLRDCLTRICGPLSLFLLRFYRPILKIDEANGENKGRNNFRLRFSVNLLEAC